MEVGADQVATCIAVDEEVCWRVDSRAKKYGNIDICNQTMVAPTR